MLDEILKYWNCEEIIDGPTTKIKYRVIASFNFQFRKIDYVAKTALLIEAVSVLSNISAVYDVAGEVDETDDSVKALLPAIIAALSNDKLQSVVSKLCATVNVDRGNGKFEPLSDISVGEAIFGEDLLMQIPVAMTAAIVNFGDSLALASKAFPEG